MVSTTIGNFEDVFGSDLELECPVCGGYNLHHSKIMIFSRNEDEEHTLVTTVEGDQCSSISQLSELTKNPSLRRDGLSIEFWCEGCDILPKLLIAQHKGSTYIGWDNFEL